MQSPGQELVTCPTMCIAGAISRYKNNNGSKVPTSIVVVYSDGQLGYIGMSERQQILKSISMVVGSSENEAPKPIITYIVVKKRIDFRFFILGSPNEPLTNPISGLVVGRIFDGGTMERFLYCGTKSYSKFSDVTSTSRRIKTSSRWTKCSKSPISCEQ
ncbi:hypothetical protein ACOME3_008710 [Neoechinorhynchus agilis]